MTGRRPRGVAPGAAPGGLWPRTERPFSEGELVRARCIVRRLQQRIVKAVQTGKWRKAQALQHLLTRSRSAKLLAVLRVTENQGKHTPGVDGVTWTTPAQKRAAVDQMRQRGYRPQPLRRVYKPGDGPYGSTSPLAAVTYCCQNSATSRWHWCGTYCCSAELAGAPCERLCLYEHEERHRKQCDKENKSPADECTPYWGEVGCLLISLEDCNISPRVLAWVAECNKTHTVRGGPPK